MISLAHRTTFALVVAVSVAAFAETFTPKYGPMDRPRATLLKKNREHIRTARAADFWALIPYYEGMRGDHSAAAASLATALNGLRQGTKYSSSVELVTEESLLQKVKKEDFAARLQLRSEGRG